MVHARQGKLVTLFLQVPVAQPANGGQVLRLAVRVIAVQMVDGQDMAAYLEAFGPPAMLTAMPSTDFDKLEHSLKKVQPSFATVPGLEVAVYLILGG